MLTEKELGERLKNVRKMRNISQFRMADMMGTEQSFIAKLEKGASYPKVSTLCLKIYSDGNAQKDSWQSRNPNDFCSYGEPKEDTC